MKTFSNLAQGSLLKIANDLQQETRQISVYPLSDGIFITGENSIPRINDVVPPPRSKRLALTTLLAPFTMGNSEMIVSWPSGWTTPDVLRIQNGNLLIWTQSDFVIVPLTVQAKRRLLAERLAREGVQNTQFKQFLPEDRTPSSAIGYAVTEQLRHQAVGQNENVACDQFLQRYFEVARKLSGLQDGHLIGPQHGDFHINNILISSSGEFKIIDWSTHNPHGLPHSDLVSFAMHYLGFFKYKDYIRAIRELAESPDRIIDEMEKSGFQFLAQELKIGISPAVVELFFAQIHSWFEANVSDPPIKEQIITTYNNWKKSG